MTATLLVVSSAPIRVEFHGIHLGNKDSCVAAAIRATNESDKFCMYVCTAFFYLIFYIFYTVDLKVPPLFDMTAISVLLFFC